MKSEETAAALPAVAIVEESHYAAPVRVPLAVEDGLAVLSLAALCLITLANVLVRYFTDHSLAWTEEISVFLLIVSTLAGGCAAVARNSHIRIEYFSAAGSAARRRRLARFGALCTVLFFTVLGALSIRLVWDEYRWEETTPGIGLPKWWYSIWMPVMSFAIALRALGLFLRQGERGDQGGQA